MKDSTSLDLLHDIAVPPEVPWWPLATGWYFLGGAFVAASLFFGRHFWKRWKNNAYRREALQLIHTAETAASISETLRRTALIVGRRSELTKITGEKWPEWLASFCEIPMSDAVHEELAFVPYGKKNRKAASPQLREYAIAWITQHHSAKTVSSTAFESVGKEEKHADN